MGFEKVLARLAGMGLNVGFGFAAGDLALTDITIAGLKTRDQIVLALDIRPVDAIAGAALKTNLNSDISITAANTVQMATVDTTGDQVLVIWVSARF